MPLGTKLFFYAMCIAGFFVIGYATIALIEQGHKNKLCKERGGTVVKTIDGYRCARIDMLTVVEKQRLTKS